MDSFRRRIEQLLWLWLGLAAALAVLSLLLFPLYKSMPAGLLPVGIGVATAIGLRAMPERARQFARFVYGGDDWRWIGAVCLAGACLRLPLVVFPSTPITDEAVYYNWAARIAAGNGFGGELLFPPGQAMWLAMWMPLVGTGVRGLVVVQCLASLSTIPLTFLAFRPWSCRAARWAALVVAFAPSCVIWSGTFGHETVGLMLQSMVLLLLSRGVSSGTFSRWGVFAVAGVALGAAALVRPTYVAVPIVLAAAVFLVRGRLLESVLAALVVGCCMLAVISPWTIRSYRMYGQFCLVSANSGQVLLSANHPKSDGIYHATHEVGAGLDPIAQDRVRGEMAVRAIRENPLRFGALAFKRLVYMWGTDTSILDYFLGDPPRGGTVMKKAISAVIQVWWGWFVAAWAIGLWHIKPWRVRGQFVQVWAVSWTALIWATHLVFEALSRHHIALLPLLAALSLPGYFAWVTAPPEDGSSS